MSNDNEDILLKLIQEADFVCENFDDMYLLQHKKSWYRLSDKQLKTILVELKIRIRPEARKSLRDRLHESFGAFHHWCSIQNYRVAPSKILKHVDSLERMFNELSALPSHILSWNMGNLEDAYAFQDTYFRMIEGIFEMKPLLNTLRSQMEQAQNKDFARNRGNQELNCLIANFVGAWQNVSKRDLDRSAIHDATRFTILVLAEIRENYPGSISEIPYPQVRKALTENDVAIKKRVERVAKTSHWPLLDFTSIIMNVKQDRIRGVAQENSGSATS